MEINIRDKSTKEPNHLKTLFHEVLLLVQHVDKNAIKGKVRIVKHKPIDGNEIYEIHIGLDGDSLAINVSGILEMKLNPEKNDISIALEKFGIMRLALDFARRAVSTSLVKKYSKMIPVYIRHSNSSTNLLWEKRRVDLTDKGEEVITAPWKVPSTRSDYTNTLWACGYESTNSAYDLQVIDDVVLLKAIYLDVFVSDTEIRDRIQTITIDDTDRVTFNIEKKNGRPVVELNLADLRKFTIKASTLTCLPDIDVDIELVLDLKIEIDLIDGKMKSSSDRVNINKVIHKNITLEDVEANPWIERFNKSLVNIYSFKVAAFDLNANYSSSLE